MDINELLAMSNNNKQLLWDSFRYEKILEDTEEDLIKDLEYYNKKLKLLGEPESSIDVGIATVYKSHVKSINRLLGVIDNIKTSRNNESEQLTIFQ